MRQLFDYFAKNLRLLLKHFLPVSRVYMASQLSLGLT